MPGAAENRLKHRDPRERSAILPSVRVDLTAAQTVTAGTTATILWSKTFWASQPDWWDAGNAGLLVVPRPLIYQITYHVPITATSTGMTATLRVNNDANQDLLSNFAVNPNPLVSDIPIFAVLNVNDTLQLLIKNPLGSDLTANATAWLSVVAIPGSENRTGL